MVTAGWTPSGADPAAPRAEFDPKPRPVAMGHPETDRPGTMRVEDWGRRFEVDVRRVILRAVPGTVPDPEPWMLFAGHGEDGVWLAHDEVRGWPLTCELHVRVAMRDRALDGRSTGAAPAPLDGADTEGERLFR